MQIVYGLSTYERPYMVLFMQGLWTQDNAEMALAQETYVLEILKRAKGHQSGEGVSAFESEANVKEEVIRRGAKAGRCNSEGGPISSGRIIMKPATKQYRKNYKRIFGHD